MITGNRKNKLAAEIQIRNHTLVSDVSAELGGNDEGPDPHELLQAALAGCTIITVQMYANRKQWPLESTDVKIKILSEDKEGTVISRDVSFKGNLSQEQRDQLLVIANKCPIHRLLTGPVQIQTQMS
jgi:putative redox protein